MESDLPRLEGHFPFILRRSTDLWYLSRADPPPRARPSRDDERRLTSGLSGPRPETPSVPREGGEPRSLVPLPRGPRPGASVARRKKVRDPATLPPPVNGTRSVPRAKLEPLSLVLFFFEIYVFPPTPERNWSPSLWYLSRADLGPYAIRAFLESDLPT